MPKYDYECKECGIFEVEQKIQDNVYNVCPKCNSKDIMRLISKGAGVIFKGDGWSEINYKSKGEKK